jgi:hypothetical protein
MAKQGEHHKDGNDPAVARGHNKHRKSTPITTGTYRKPETAKEEMYEHKDPAKRAQDHEPHWFESTPKKLTKKDRFGEQRTGSKSNESSATRGY